MWFIYGYPRAVVNILSAVTGPVNTDYWFIVHAVNTSIRKLIATDSQDVIITFRY
jgi:hypothetical protein